MKFKVKDGMLFNEEGKIIAVLTDEITEKEEQTLEATGEALEAINAFVDDVNSGSHKPKRAVNEFQRILDKFELN